MILFSLQNKISNGRKAFVVIFDQEQEKRPSEK